MSASSEGVAAGRDSAASQAGDLDVSTVSASEEAKRAQRKIESTRAALLAKIEGHDRVVPNERRPTVASLLGEARRAVPNRSTTTSMTGSMAAASDPPRVVKAVAPSPISELGLARAARAMLGHLPIPPLVPVVESALDSAEGWWRKQPWYDASDLLLREAESALGPTIRRNPLLSVSAAAAVGAAVVMAKPWRWKALEGTFKPLPQQTKAWFSEQMQRSTVQSLAVAWVLGLVAKAGTAVATASPASAGADDVAARMSSASSSVDGASSAQASHTPAAGVGSGDRVAAH